jgi:hypothetical protein
MGAWIKGAYALQECWSVGNSITADGKAAMGLTQTSAHTALTITNNSTVKSLYVYSGTGNTGTTEHVHFQQAGAANTNPNVKITTAGTGADIRLTGRASAGMGAGTEGDIYFNATTHKLMIRGAAGWETVTSA